MGSTLKGKNFLLEKKILILNSWPLLKGEENSRVAPPVSITIYLNSVE